MDSEFLPLLADGVSAILSPESFRVYVILRAEVSVPSSDKTRELRRGGVLASALSAPDVAERARLGVLEAEKALASLASDGWLLPDWVGGDRVFRLGAKVGEEWRFFAPKTPQPTDEGCGSVEERVAWSRERIKESEVRQVLTKSKPEPETPKVKKSRGPTTASARLLREFALLYREEFRSEEPLCGLDRKRPTRDAYHRVNCVLAWVDGSEEEVLSAMGWAIGNWKRLVERRCVYVTTPELTLSLFCSRGFFFFVQRWKRSKTFPPAIDAAVLAGGSKELAVFHRADRAALAKEKSDELWDDL